MEETIYSTSDVSDWVIARIKEISDVVGISADSKISSLKIDSVSLVGLMADVEDNFGVQIDDPSIVYQKKRVSDLVAYLMELIDGK